MRFLAILLLLLSAAPVQAGQMQLELGGRNVTAWTPPPLPGKQPLILFSHGFHGMPIQSTFLTSALAANGYWVFAPEHRDSGFHQFFSGGKPFTFFARVDQWDDQTYSDRRDDMKAVLAALKTDPRFKDRIDFNRIGLVGHSLGGYTVLGLAGARESWRMPGISAVLALCPYGLPYTRHHTLGGIEAPAMYQCGSIDLGINPSVEEAYTESPIPKYYVEIEGAGHFAWTDLNREHHALIDRYSLAFLDHYVKGSPAAALLTVKEPGIRRLLSDTKGR